MNCVGDVSGLFWSPQFQVLKEIRSFAAPKIGQDCICQPPTSRCDRVHREGYCTPQKSPWLILSPKRWLCLGDQCRTLAKTAFKWPLLLQSYPAGVVNPKTLRNSGRNLPVLLSWKYLKTSPQAKDMNRTACNPYFVPALDLFEKQVPLNCCSGINI